MSDLSLPMYCEEQKTSLQFEVVATRNDIASDRMGRAMFDKLLRIYISNPGHKDVQTYEVEREWAEGHPLHGQIRKNEVVSKKYGKYIEAFKRDATSDIRTGTPISVWPLVDVRMAATFKHLGIQTVEQLAEISDTAIGNIGMGGRDWVRKAKDWIQSAQNSAMTTQLSSEKKALEDKMAAMQEQITALADAFATLDEEQQTKVKAELGKRGRKAA